MRKVFLLLLIAALVIPFAAPAEGNGVITSGDFSYKLDKYDRATVLTMNGATDQEGLWLVPKTVEGHPVEQVSADCIPEDVHEILMPSGCFLRVLLGGLSYLSVDHLARGKQEEKCTKNDFSGCHVRVYGCSIQFFSYISAPVPGAVLCSFLYRSACR